MIGSITFTTGKFKGTVAELDDRGQWQCPDPMIKDFLASAYTEEKFAHPASLPWTRRVLAEAAKDLKATLHFEKPLDPLPDGVES